LTLNYKNYLKNIDKNVDEEHDVEPNGKLLHLITLNYFIGSFTN